MVLATKRWFADPKQLRLECPTAVDAAVTNTAGPVGRERLQKLCKWLRVEPEGSVVMLPAGPSPVPTNDAVAVAWAELTIGKPQRVKLGIGSDDGVRVWVNGRQVLNRPVLRALTPDEDEVAVDLVAGRNEIIVKCFNWYGGWAFAVDVAEMDGQPVDR